ncbi:MAG: hypothetical protein HN403_07210 [Rhodospirillales bacterium]|jgi:cell division protein FtsL|nr:hypothetical protein [Rhodospirillales bacterium]
MIRQATLLAILLAAALSVVLFGVKYQVQDLEDELSSIDRGILNEERAIHVLRAEWSHLNDPERLRRLAERHLDLRPVSARQVGAPQDLSELPQKAENGSGAASAKSVAFKERGQHQRGVR